MSENCILYEHKTITIKRELAQIYLENYKNFGWETEDTRFSFTDIGDVTIRFKRDRKIPNKVELTRLEKQFDACVQELLKLEKSKTKGPAITALVIGTVGLVLTGGAVFTAVAGKVAAGIALAVPGSALTAASYGVYNKQTKSKTEKVTPQIDQKYDEIYEVCERASELLS